MDYQKYSKKSFDHLGVDTEAARKLADDLQCDVLDELHVKIKSALLEIISCLNANGNNLKPYGEILPGDMGFRDDGALRLGVDVVISAGYAHTYDDEI